MRCRLVLTGWLVLGWAWLGLAWGWSKGRRGWKYTDRYIIVVRARWQKGIISRRDTIIFSVKVARVRARVSMGKARAYRGTVLVWGAG